MKDDPTIPPEHHIPPSMEPDVIDWYIEPMLYIGYQTTDEKLANTLLFELVRSNTLHGPRFKVQADYEFLSTGLLYKVWVTPLAEPEAEEKA